MNVLRVYARIYADCLKKTFRGLLKNAWTLVLPGALLLVFGLLTLLLSTLLPPIVVGFLIGFAMAGLLSCYLYFLGEVVGNSRVRVRDVATSIRAYFWSVVNIMFVLWVARILGNMVLSNLPEGDRIWTALTLAAVIAFNATPEVIYQCGTYGGLATFQRSLKFLQENWIEWGIPNVLILAGGLKLMEWSLIPVMLMGAVGLGGIGYLLATNLISGAFLHLLMVFRGHLFAALDGSSHRQRMFKFRNSVS